MAPIEALERAYLDARADAAFRAEFDRLLANYVGRPTPLWEAANLSAACGGARVFLKREDLNHTGAHKINNALGQALLARRMGKRRVIAETGAGQHGVASATAAALLGLECVVYMGTEDMARQALNVFRMRLLGAEVRGVASGSATLKDAINEAMRDWVAHPDDSTYLLGSALGPHPYPLMVREFQSVIGPRRGSRSSRRRAACPMPSSPASAAAATPSASSTPSWTTSTVRLIGVEAGGDGIVAGRHAARFAGGAEGVLQGTRTWLLQDADGNIEPTHSVSAGLDYAAVGPEHAWLHALGRAEYTWADDGAALAAFHQLARLEGIMPALESAHAIAHLATLGPQLGAGAIVVVNLSGRGDKDVHTVESLSKEGR